MTQRLSPTGFAIFFLVSAVAALTFFVFARPSRPFRYVCDSEGLLKTIPTPGPDPRAALVCVDDGQKYTWVTVEQYHQQGSELQ